MKFNYSLDLDVSKIIGRLDYTKKGLFGLRQKAAMNIAEDIMEESQARIPRDTGAMASTDFITDTGSTVLFGYDGGTATNPKTGELVSEYLITQHEDTTLNHPNGGEAKFLEKAIDHQAEYEAQETIYDATMETLANAFSDWTPKWRGRGKPKGRGVKK